MVMNWAVDDKDLIIASSDFRIGIGVGWSTEGLTSNSSTVLSIKICVNLEDHLAMT